MNNPEDRYCKSMLEFANQSPIDKAILNQDPLPEELYDTYLEYQLCKPTRTLEELEQDLYKYNAEYKTVCNPYSLLILWMIKNRHPLYINAQYVKYIPKPQYFLVPKDIAT